MRAFGSMLIAVGLLMAFAAFSMHTSVYGFGGEVNNLGLLQQQMMVLQTGLAGFISGSVLVAGSPAVPSSAPSAVAGSAVRRDDESDEEREERVAGVRRLNRNIGISLAGLLLFLILVAVVASEIG
jgi:hypothetical protein